MHIVFKFQFFKNIFAMVKLKKTTPKFKRGYIGLVHIIRSICPIMESDKIRSTPAVEQLVLLPSET